MFGPSVGFKTKAEGDEALYQLKRRALLEALEAGRLIQAEAARIARQRKAAEALLPVYQEVQS
jgi:hypothetical protein